jgi:hypothetical protein
MNLLNVLPRARAARLQPDQLEPPTHYRLPASSARRDTDRSRDMTDDYMAMDPLPRIESEMSRR